MIFKDIFFKELIFEDFYFFNIGHEQCQPEHAFGPGMREYYILHYIVKGHGKYKVGNVTYHLKKGDFFLIRPGELIEYVADPIIPWEYYWLGFAGTKVTELLNLNGIGQLDHSGKLQFNQDIEASFNWLLNVNFFDDKQKIIAQAAFLKLFSYFTIQQSRNRAVQKGKSFRKYSESFLLYIQNNYYRNELTIEEIAKSMYLNPSYFSQMIKDEIGVTAIDYLKSYRMSKAAFLLQTSDLTIEEIAVAVGYQNRHSFTRAFKAAYECTPSQYNM